MSKKYVFTHLYGTEAEAESARILLMGKFNLLIEKILIFPMPYGSILQIDTYDISESQLNEIKAEIEPLGQNTRTQQKNAIETTVAEESEKPAEKKPDKEPQPKTIPRTKHSHAIRTPITGKNKRAIQIIGYLFLFLALLMFSLYISGIFNRTSKKTPPPSPILLSIKVAPNPSIDLIVGDTEQFTATGTYSDGSTNDISSQVTWIADWTSGNNIVANISSIGLAIGLTPGRTDITAFENGTTSLAVTLIVKAAMPVTTTPTLTSINIDYSGAFYPNLTVGYAQYFKATGNYSDGSVANITSQVAWLSSDPSIAAISSTGLATGIARGTTYITASMPGITSKPITLMVVMNTTQSPTTGVKTASLPTINLLPTSGSPGTSIMIDCLNFTPYATVRSADILWDNIPCSGGFTDSVSSTGRFTTLLDLNPNTTSGTHIITVADSSGKKASATFIVVSQTTTTNSTAVPTTQAASLPTITLTPATGIAGSPIMVTGYNFTPGGTVKSGDVTWNGGPLTFSQTYDVDITGKVTFLLILSDNAIPGTYKLVMTDSSGKQASATFIVN